MGWPCSVGKHAALRAGAVGLQVLMFRVVQRVAVTADRPFRGVQQYHSSGIKSRAAAYAVNLSWR